MKLFFSLLILCFVCRSVHLLHAQDCLEKAKAENLAPGPVCLSMAKSLMSKGSTQQALEQLRKAVSAGFAQPNLLTAAKEFQDLQNNLEFKKIVEGAQKNATPCPFSEEFRKFDFWIGEWDVYTNDQLAGQSSIQVILDQCVIFENWTGRGGYSGKSFNVYNKPLGKWQQFWVDNSGGVLELSGEFHDPELRFTGETQQQDGSTIREKLVFTKLPGDQVRQVWQQSKDNGTTWTTVFDGLYKRRTK